MYLVYHAAFGLDVRVMTLPASCHVILTQRRGTAAPGTQLDHGRVHREDQHPLPGLDRHPVIVDLAQCAVAAGALPRQVAAPCDQLRVLCHRLHRSPFGVVAFGVRLSFGPRMSEGIAMRYASGSSSASSRASLAASRALTPGMSSSVCRWSARATVLLSPYSPSRPAAGMLATSCGRPLTVTCSTFSGTLVGLVRLVA